MLVQLHILLRVLHRGLNQFEANDFLSFRAEADADRSSAAADVEENCLLIDTEECLHLVEHFFKNIDIDLEECKRADGEAEAHYLIGIMHRVTN